jgi:hypothetical protein
VRIAPIITAPGGIFSPQRDTNKIVAMLPKPKLGFIWKYTSPPFNGPALRFSTAEDATDWVNSFVDGKATKQGKFIEPWLNGEWNPKYKKAMFEVAFFLETKA